MHHKLTFSTTDGTQHEIWVKLDELWFDHAKNTLDGSDRYIIHVSKGTVVTYELNQSNFDSVVSQTNVIESSHSYQTVLEKIEQSIASGLTKIDELKKTINDSLKIVSDETKNGLKNVSDINSEKLSDLKTSLESIEKAIKGETA